ncbi:MAG: DNA/RNA non-specific endonuclease [Thermoleophilaceae bacterium]|nr:DNA/RNA non-specific endonuclease [Thermoleophilaceae bacterium]
MSPFEAGRRVQSEAAAERFQRHAGERRDKLEALRSPGGVAQANESGRVARRLDRLSRYYAGEDLPARPGETPRAAPEDVLAAALERGHLPARATVPDEHPAAPGVVLERIINTPDFVDIRYLEGGVAAARAVCRVRIRDRAGRVVGHGTGSLVSPRLLLTNHHVLENAEVAAASAAEFNFQDGLDGQPLQAQLLSLDPDAFFVADQERDFALVAVRGSEGEVARFGFNPLVEAEGKAVIGEFVTIVQHPRGEKKQVSLRENRIVDLPEAFMHYEADTEPGSSGSPVFNDQWEVVALHHASVPAPEHGELGGFLNEGIRISQILRFLGEQSLEADQRALVDQLRLERIVLPQAPVSTVESPPIQGPREQQLDIPAPGVTAPGEQATIQLNLPLESTLGLGGAVVADPGARPGQRPGVGVDEAIVIDPDYSSRSGYDPAFLGPATLSVPLPVLSAELVTKAAVNSAATEEGHVLRYHNFSVAINRERRLAFFTAVNIDGALSRRLRREKDRWLLDPRLPAEHQTGELVYADNDLDRGHLVRRLDPAWGTSDATAKLANDDTFHFTNCTPQHKDFNQRQTSWAGLEDYILENADNRDFKVSVFTGPVFASDDEEYRGVKLPRQFWKVVIMVKADGQPSATAYLLSQESLLQGLEAEEQFSYAAYRTYQVQVARIADLTGLSFGALENFDPLAGGLEAATTPREVKAVADLVL